MLSENERRGAKTDLSFTAQASKRTTEAVSLREKKREEKLREKRQALIGGAGGGPVADSGAVPAALPPAARQQMSQQDLSQLAVAMYSQSPDEQYAATKAIRKLLAQEHDPPIEAVMELSPAVIPQLVNFLRQPNENLQFEAAWALTNITSGPPEPTPHVVKAGAIPALVALVRSKNKDVVEQSVWALGNIAGEKSKFRDMVLECRLIPPLVDLILSDPPGSIMSNATWTLANLLRGKPQPAEQFIRQALPVLVQLLRHSVVTVKVDALWALSYVTDGKEELVADVQRMDGLVPTLMQFLHPKTDYPVLCPAVRTAGNFLTGTDEATEMMLRYGILDALSVLLDYQKNNIQKECCWALSNICAGSPEHIQRVLEAGLLPKVVSRLAAGSASIELRKEAVWVMINLAEKGTLQQLDVAVQAGCIGPMVEMLEPRLQAVLLTHVLSGLLSIAEKGQMLISESLAPENVYARQMIEAGVEDRLLALADHTPSVRQSAEELLLLVKNTDAMDYFGSAAQDGFVQLGGGGGGGLQL